ncbi:MAG: hypothetical protein WC407_00005, partial [Sulfuricurvum sp.]
MKHLNQLGKGAFSHPTMLLSLFFAALPLCADDSFTLFNNAKFNGEVRTRYENVDVQNSTKKDANAYTVRAT